MTPAERAKAYYEDKRRDKTWMASQAQKARERYARTHIRAPKIPIENRTKMSRIKAAIAFTENRSSPEGLGALEHLAWIAWRGWRACEAAGSRGPWDLKSGKCWAEIDAP